MQKCESTTWCWCVTQKGEDPRGLVRPQTVSNIELEAGPGQLNGRGLLLMIILHMEKPPVLQAAARSKKEDWVIARFCGVC